MESPMKQIYAALIAAQSEFKPAKFDCVNPHFRSKYASLTCIMDTIKAALAKNGLAITQSVGIVDGKPSFVETQLIHTSGERLSGFVPIIIGKQDMQGLGSALTYGRRYGISALLGVVSEEDDDGNASVEQTKQEKTVIKAPPPELGDFNFDPVSDMLAEKQGMGSIGYEEAANHSCGYGKKYYGVKLKDMGKEKVKSFADWLKSEKKTGEAVDTFIRNAEIYLKG